MKYSRRLAFLTLLLSTSNAKCPRSEDLNVWWETNCLSQKECCHNAHGCVYCMGNGNITTIQLIERNLTGTIPSEFSTFGAMTILRLHKNQLTGSIPAELGDLPLLEYLMLNSNNFTGAVPSELGTLRLDQLKLGSNPGLFCPVANYDKWAHETDWNLTSTNWNDYDIAYGANGITNCAEAPIGWSRPNGFAVGTCSCSSYDDNLPETEARYCIDDDSVCYSGKRYCYGQAGRRLCYAGLALPTLSAVNYRQIAQTGLYGGWDGVTKILDKYECKPGFKIDTTSFPGIYSATLSESVGAIQEPAEFCSDCAVSNCDIYSDGCYCEACASGFRAFNGWCVGAEASTMAPSTPMAQARKILRDYGPGPQDPYILWIAIAGGGVCLIMMVAGLCMCCRSKKATDYSRFQGEDLDLPGPGETERIVVRDSEEEKMLQRKLS